MQLTTEKCKQLTGKIIIYKDIVLAEKQERTIKRNGNITKREKNMKR